MHTHFFAAKRVGVQKTELLITPPDGAIKATFNLKLWTLLPKCSLLESLAPLNASRVPYKRLTITAQCSEKQIDSQISEHFQRIFFWQTYKNTYILKTTHKWQCWTWTDGCEVLAAAQKSSWQNKNHTHEAFFKTQEKLSEHPENGHAETKNVMILELDRRFLIRSVLCADKRGWIGTAKRVDTKVIRACYVETLQFCLLTFFIMARTVFS